MAQQSETSSATLTQTSRSQAIQIAIVGARSIASHLHPGFYTRAWRRSAATRSRWSRCWSRLYPAFLLRRAGRVDAFRLRLRNRRPAGQAARARRAGAPARTDANGRDILTRLAYGGRVSMMVSVLAVFSALFIAARRIDRRYYGGFIDSLSCDSSTSSSRSRHHGTAAALSVWFGPVRWDWHS